MDLILHAGTGKTGTTSIQRFLRLNRAALARHDVLFPVTPGQQRHVGFALFVTPDDEFVGSRTAIRQARAPAWGQLIEESPAAFRSAFRQALLDEIRESGLSRVLISDESLFPSSDPRLQLTRAFTRHHARSLRLVCYLRRQDDHLISRYQQAVKWGEVRRLVDRTVQLETSSYDYAKQLDRWTRIVAPTDIVVRRFAPHEFHNGSLIEDFLAAAGIDVPVESEEEPPTVNVSLDAETVEFLRILNLHKTSDPDAAGVIRQRRLLRRLSRAAAGPQLTLPEDVLDRFMSRWEAGNRRVAKRYFGEEGDLFTWARKSNTTTRQYLDPSRLEHFLEVSGVPESIHAPLRRLVEREASVG